LYTANVGDSPALLSRNGMAICLFEDHNGKRHMGERTRIEELGGYFAERGYVLGKLNMTRAIGNRELKPYVIATPFISKIELTKQHEFLVICSDGVSDVLMNNQIIYNVETNIRSAK